jgi:cystathionine beta-lyase/cystathionine gamma-synthase
MEDNNMLKFIKEVLKNMPTDWLRLTTHRLDIYDEQLAKTEFIHEFEKCYQSDISDVTTLSSLPTAYDYIRLGHPLSCVLEWTIAKMNGVKSSNVICFSSQMMPVMAVLRKNHFDHRNTRILYSGEPPSFFDADVLRKVYGYQFELKQVNGDEPFGAFDGSTIFFSQQNEIGKVDDREHIDFFVQADNRPAGTRLGSVIIVNGESNESYISEIQHVRRRESIAMTPANCLIALQQLVKVAAVEPSFSTMDDKAAVIAEIANITGVQTKALVGSSGLSIQYAILMGLVHHAVENHPGKAIKIVVPPNCYGGTNDQARRVAACLKNVEILDLAVDGGNDMVKSVEAVLTKTAKEDAVPFIIAEIPTNPRVEVPDLLKLRKALSKERRTPAGTKAIDPVFILDQTFCPNVHFLGDQDILSSVRTISFASGSKFPSGGLCTAGYCAANERAEGLMDKIARHLALCDNEPTQLQYEVLAKQMPSMLQRIEDAYVNTREFVNFIRETLPSAKINFVSEELAQHGFKPSVFSLDLPTKGSTEEERETYKRALNLRLINRMITEIPNESKYCVSYGQLKGCYWTIPATSTQGTTKEGDKDYIARVALSPSLDLERHKKVFRDFVASI